MPSTVGDLLRVADLHPGGTVRWGEAVPVQSPGVYLVSGGADPEAAGIDLSSAPISTEAVDELLRVRPDLTIDYQPARGQTLADRLGEFWLPDESILYIGLAGTSLSQRVDAYYKTKLGRRSPHAGGWFLKLLAILDDLYVHYAAAEDVAKAEDQMLAAFVGSVSATTRGSLRDPDHPFPYANLEWPKGVRKNHGIRGATGSPATGRTAAGPSGESEQNYPRHPRPGTDVAAINHYLQEELRRRERNEVAAVEAAAWLDSARLLTDSKVRPGLPLRDLLRAGLITGQRQEPNRRWFIDRN